MDVGGEVGGLLQPNYDRLDGGELRTGCIETGLICQLFSANIGDDVVFPAAALADADSELLTDRSAKSRNDIRELLHGLRCKVHDGSRIEPAVKLPNRITKLAAGRNGC